MSRSADSLAREHTERAIRTIADVMDSPFSEDRDRLRAAELVLDRGHGKPNQAIIQIPANRQVAAMLAKMSDDELMAALNQHQLPRLAPIEAEFTEIDPLLL
jgi:hypothetical protein